MQRRHGRRGEFHLPDGTTYVRGVPTWEVVEGDANVHHSAAGAAGAGAAGAGGAAPASSSVEMRSPCTPPTSFSLRRLGCTPVRQRPRTSGGCDDRVTPPTTRRRLYSPALYSIPRNADEAARAWPLIAPPLLHSRVRHSLPPPVTHQPPDIPQHSFNSAAEFEALRAEVDSRIRLEEERRRREEEQRRKRKEEEDERERLRREREKAAREQAEKEAAEREKEKAIAREKEEAAAKAEAAKAEAARIAKAGAREADEVSAEEEFLNARTQWKTYLQTEYQQMSSDVAERSFRAGVRKSINLPINQVASTTSQIKNTCERIQNFLKQFANEPKRLRYAIAACLECCLDCCEVQCGGNPSSVWAFAQMLALLGLDCRPAFSSRCLYIHPYFVTKTKDMSSSEFHLRRDQRADESEADYFQRQSTLLRFYMAVLVCSENRKALWTWWARFCNCRPRRITGNLLDSALEVTGFFSLRLFGRQFRKLLRLINAHMLAAIRTLHAKDSTGILSAPLSRVVTKLEKYSEVQNFDLPEGFSMPQKASEEIM